MALTNDELLQDLKQFIAATVSQQTQLAKDEIITQVDDKISNVESRLDSRLVSVDSRLVGIESRLDNVEVDISDIKESQNEILNTFGIEVIEVQKTQKNHEIRIAKLEAKAA